VDRAWQELLRHSPGQPVNTLPDRDEEELRQVLYGPQAPANVPVGESSRLLDRAARNRLSELRRQVEQFQATSPAAPPRALALEDAPPPPPPHVFLRGTPNTPGGEVPRQFLRVLAGERRQPFQRGSGRLELAQAIASPDNPLTARVLVNRVWLHHF